MARPLRIEYPGAVCHITSRGNEKKGEGRNCRTPKSQRYLDRPNLEKIFPENILHDIGKRNEKIKEAVERYGYRQREVAEYLEMHFTSISRILRERELLTK